MRNKLRRNVLAGLAAMAVIAGAAAISFSQGVKSARKNFHDPFNTVYTALTTPDSNGKDALTYTGISFHFDSYEKTDAVILLDARNVGPLHEKQFINMNPFPRDILSYLARTGAEPITFYLTEEAEQRINQDEELRRIISKYVSPKTNKVVVPRNSLREKSLMEGYLEGLLPTEPQERMTYSEPGFFKGGKRF